ncbi:GH25 family lysozyme [Glutamicibacter uratoxydans]|uniref:GH25 family lysozyme n=1 Tax=Glutamicibacter uratoxydans TaxID=43667 RepID=UPI003D6FB1F7
MFRSNGTRSRRAPLSLALSLGLAATVCTPVSAAVSTTQDDLVETAESVDLTQQPASATIAPTTTPSSQPSEEAQLSPAPKAESPAQVAQAIESRLESDTDISNQERRELADRVLSALDLEYLDAQLGQGQQRVEETGDPTIPTVQELELLAQIAANNGQVPNRPELSFPGSQSDLRTWRAPGTLGIDVSHHQGTVNWSQARQQGARFAYIKATQSWPTTVFKDPQFDRNYTQAQQAGVIRGAYHFAMPAHSSGKTQAHEFLGRGGGWSADGQTMPPLLDIEWNPYPETTYNAGKGDSCYGMTSAQLQSWIQDFGQTIKSATGRLPMIYTAQSWWDDCIGQTSAFKNWPLHVSIFPTADVAKNPRQLPAGWTTFNVWQYTDNSNLLGNSNNVDANVWNGTLTSLQDFARNKQSTPYRLITDYRGDASSWPVRLAPLRISGQTLYDTPVAISKRTFSGTAQTVVIASGERFPDALSGSSLATLKSGPMLLIKKNSIPAAVAAELRRLKPKQIIVLGGPVTISDKTAAALKSYGPVKRIWGNTLYDTSTKITANWKSSKEVFVATGERFEDAMSLAAVAAGRKTPMLLTKHSQVPAPTIKELKRLKPTQVHLAGGPIAISAAAEKQIRQAVPNAKVTRHAGDTLYDTSALIAKKFWPNGSQRQFIATGTRFPDGLTGAVAAGYNQAPLLLSTKRCLPGSIADTLEGLEGWTNILLGGPLVLDETVAYRTNGHVNRC